VKFLLQSRRDISGLENMEVLLLLEWEAINIGVRLCE